MLDLEHMAGFSPRSGGARALITSLFAGSEDLEPEVGGLIMGRVLS
jgi:hypothetical protein